MNGPEGRSGGRAPVSRSTLRLTFRITDEGVVELLSTERLGMITPPQPGARPQAGRHGGYWFELRNAQGQVLAHRLLDPTLLNSVEVHSPDGAIRREFGPMRPGVFEVLLPDTADAAAAVLVGPQAGAGRGRIGPAGAGGPSGDLARFDLATR